MTIEFVVNIYIVWAAVLSVGWNILNVMLFWCRTHIHNCLSIHHSFLLCFNGVEHSTCHPNRQNYTHGYKMKWIFTLTNCTVHVYKTHWNMHIVCTDGIDPFEMRVHLYVYDVCKSMWRHNFAKYTQTIKMSSAPIKLNEWKPIKAFHCANRKSGNYFGQRNKLLLNHHMR